MQWVRQATGQAGDRAAHLAHSGAVVRLVVKDRLDEMWQLCATGEGWHKRRVYVVSGFGQSLSQQHL